jgi:hypothetical protein
LVNTVYICGTSAKITYLNEMNDGLHTEITTLGEYETLAGNIEFSLH